MEIFSLKKIEKLIIILLVATLLLGLAIITYRKYRPAAKIDIGTFDTSVTEDGQQGSSLSIAGKININEASAEELMRLDRVGKVMAERIISYRQLHGPFASTGDIKNVKGIGKALFEKIKDNITVE